MKIVPVPRTITVSSDIAGTYAPPAVHEPITTAICGIPSADMRAWLKKIRPKWSRSGKTSACNGRNAAARVDQVEAGQPVLACDLLCAQVLLHRERVVRPALDGGVVCDDHALPAFDDADSGDDPGRRCVAVVQIPGGEGVQLEERRSGIHESIDPLTCRELAAGTVPLGRLLAAAGPDARRALAQLRDELLHPGAPPFERLVPFNGGAQSGHDGRA